MAVTVDTGSLSAQATAGTNTSLVINAPTGVASGDLIIAEIAAQGLSGLGVPTNFQLLVTAPTSNNMIGHLYGKVATGSEPSTYTFTCSAVTGWSGRTFIVDGADLSTFPTSTEAGESSGTSTTSSVATSGGVTLPADGLLLGICTSRVTGGTITSDGSAMTALHTTDAFSSRCMRVFYQSPAAGATGTRAFTIAGGSSASTCAIVGLNPAAAGGTSYTLTADAGSLSLSGTAATLKAGRKVTADSGAYSLSGSAAALLLARKIGANAGAVSLTGSAASLLFGRKISAASGSFVITGTDATLTFDEAGGFTLVADPGAVSIGGTAASLLYGRKVPADSGAVSLTGAAASLLRGYRVVVDAGAFTLTGQAATLRIARRLGSDPGSVVITGTGATLSWSGADIPEAPSERTIVVLLESRSRTVEAESRTLVVLEETRTITA